MFRKLPQHHTQRLNLKAERGFTLIETLIAITILTVSIAGPLVIASKGLSASVYARDQITAFYLAQEAIEFVHNERDSAALDARISGNSDFAARFGVCAGGPCIVDIRDSSVVACDGACPELLYDESTGLFSHALGDPSLFTRSMEIESVNENEFVVRVTMSWSSGLLERSFSIQENLLMWSAEPSAVGNGSSLREQPRRIADARANSYGI